MARIARKHLKIFARDANNNGVFGSAADNTKILSNDVETIQSKPAWLTGWLQAVIGTRKFPTLEEFQSVNYVNTSQIAYILQEGIPEWNALTEYYQNSIVRKTGTYEIYGSLTDNNVGNLLTDTLNWTLLQDLAITTIPDATTLVKGIAMLATRSDVLSGNNDKIVTPNLLNESGFITGDVKATTRPTLQSGWVWACGTIGNAGSGANYANAAAYELFKLYWNATEYNYTGSTATGAALQVWNGATAVSKGSSADLDWNAGRRISVPDMRDRVIAGRGNMIGNAGRLSGQPLGVNGNGLGNSGGRESDTLTINTMPNHSHGNVPMYVPSGDVDRGSNNSIFSLDNLGITSSVGGGQPHNNVQPTIICNYVIKL